MNKAVRVYHIINVLHLIFYAYLTVQVFNLGDIRSMVFGYYRLILFGYLLLILVLTIYARTLDKTAKNPIHTHSIARYLHFGAIAVFVIGFLLSVKQNPQFVYLILLSFPLDLVAFILVIRNFTDDEDKNDVIDDFQFDENDS